MSLEDLTRYFLRRDLSGDEITKLIGRPPVLYSNLGSYSSVKQLLGKYGYVVILYQKTQFDGHYVALFQDKNGNLNFQDSYGFKPDMPINMGLLPYDEPLPRYLSNLLDSSGMRVIINDYDYQKGKRKGYSDCGRHACLRILCRNLSNDQYRIMLTHNKSAFLTADHCAVLLTMLSLGDLNM